VDWRGEVAILDLSRRVAFVGYKWFPWEPIRSKSLRGPAGGRGGRLSGDAQAGRASR